MGWDGIVLEGWMDDDGVGSSEKQGIRIFFSGGVRFVFLGWNIPGWCWVRLAWLGFWEAKQCLGKKIKG